jgi:hypothetical protein
MSYLMIVAINSVLFGVFLLSLGIVCSRTVPTARKEKEDVGNGK